jgi:hypothetical protein
MSSRESFFNIIQYYVSGVPQIQTWLDTFILRQEVGHELAGFLGRMIPFPVEPYKFDEFPKALQGTLGFFTVIPLIIPFMRICFNILSERVLPFIFDFMLITRNTGEEDQ